jgi:hypothetical protein
LWDNLSLCAAIFAIPAPGTVENLWEVIARSHGEWNCGEVMTTKQSARPHLDSVNRDCFVVSATPHRRPALLAKTPLGVFQRPRKEDWFLTAVEKEIC